MNRNFVFKAILLPILTAVALAAIFVFVIGKSVPALIPFGSGTIAYHDAVSPSDEMVSADSDYSPESNDLIGTLESKEAVSVRYNADYSRLYYDASLLEDGALPGETGCVYIKTTSALIKGIDTDKKLKLDGVFGKHSYKFEKELTARNEQSVTSLAPDFEKSLAVYCRMSDGNGIKEGFKVLIFKEVSD